MSRGVFALVLQHLHRAVSMPESPVPTDGQLLERFLRDREEDVFATLVRRHAAMVLSVARRVLHDAHEAEDVFQATFFVLARKAGSIWRRPALAGWLHQVAHHLALKAKAEQIRRHALEGKTWARPQILPDDNLNREELRAVLDQELSRLPEKYRAPLVIHYLEGKSKHETAGQLGLTEGMASGRLARARRLLQKRLVRRGLDLGTVLAAASIAEAGAKPVLPALLVANVIRSAVSLDNLLAADALAGISPKVTALADTAMTATAVKVKIGLVLLMMTGVLGVGLGFSALQPSKPESAPPAKQAAADKKEPAESKPAPGFDAYGDLLPDGAVARFGSTRWRSEHPVSSLGFTADGKEIVSANWGAGIQVLETATGKELRRWAKTQRMRRVICLPGARTVASVGSYARTGSEHKIIRLWDSTTGAEIRHFAGHDGEITILASSPDGKTLASAASDKTIRLWSVSTGKQLRSLQISAENGCLAWSIDGAVLAFGTHLGNVGLLDVSTGKLLRELTNHSGHVRELTWSPNSRLLASGGSDGTIRLWDPRTGQEVRVLGGGTAKEINEQIKKLRRPSTEKLDVSKTGYLGSVNALTFSHDGKLLYSGSSNYHAILVWDVATGKETRRLEPSRVFCMVRSSDGKHLAVGGSDRIQLWDLETYKLLNPPTGPQGRVDSVAFSPDGNILATAGDDQDIRLWEVGTRRELTRLPRRDPEAGGLPVEQLKFSPDGKLLVVAGPYHWIIVWDWAAGKEVYRFVDKNAYGRGPRLAFSSDGTTLAATFHGVTFWDMVTGKELRRFDGRNGTAEGGSAIAISPDSRRLALGSIGKIALFDTHSGKLVQAFENLDESVLAPSGHKFFNSVTSVAFSRDGKSLLSGAYDGKVRLWETATGKQRHTFEGHKESIQSVAFSPDEKYAASASGSIWDEEDNSVRLWNMSAGKEIRRFLGHQNVVVSTAFSPNGRFLASGSEDGTALLWDLSAATSFPGPTSKKPSADGMASLWADLASSDAARAYQAMRILMANTAESTAFLKRNLKPAAVMDSKRIEQWVNDLDSGQFATRNNATQELEKCLGQGEQALRRQLKAQSSLEMRQRIQGLLTTLEHPSGDNLRSLRAIEVLEHLATGEARHILSTVADGPALELATKEARYSVERLGKKGP